MDNLNRDDLSEMIFRLAHGIRNPLATIKTGIQLVKHISGPDEEAMEYLNSALESVERINSIIKDVQRYVKIGPTSPKKTSVPTMINEVVLAMKVQFEKEEINLIITTGEPSFVYADPFQLTSAIQELLENALDHSHKNSNVALSWTKEDGQVCIHIEDSCGGIKPETEDKILKPFFSTSRNGTGLGLNIVSKFLDQSNGNLKMLPSYHKGCRFTIELPEV